MGMFWRMNQFCGFNQSPFSNGVSYDAFRKGYFMAVYDLTTSGKAGKVILFIKFFESLPVCHNNCPPNFFANNFGNQAWAR